MQRLQTWIKFLSFVDASQQKPATQYNKFLSELNMKKQNLTVSSVLKNLYLADTLQLTCFLFVV